MKIRIMGAVVMLGLLAVMPAVASQPTAQCKAYGRAALAAFTQGNFDQVNKHFAPALASKATPAMLKAAWQQLGSKFGTFQKLDKLQPQTVQGRDVLVARATFTNDDLDALVACNASNQIVGFQFVPASMVPAAASTTASSSAASAIDHVPGVVSRAVQVPSPLGPLPGLLDVPAGSGPFPAVVLAAGSGPNDMDETIGPNKPFRDIAIGLAKAGIATLRFDKRAHVYAMNMAGKPITVDDEATDDVVSAARVLAKQPHVDTDRLFVLGHSEGAMLAPRIAKKSGQLAGIVMLAAPARPLLDVMADQFRARAAAGVISEASAAKREKGIVAERKLLAHAQTAHPPEGSFFHAPHSFWLSLRDYHPVAVAKSLSLPMLILQGSKDIQVSPTKDFAVWKKALGDKPHVTFHLYPGLTHLFTPGEGTLADYAKAEHVSPAVVGDIATWIKAQ